MVQLHYRNMSLCVLHKIYLDVYSCKMGFFTSILICKCSACMCMRLQLAAHSWQGLPVKAFILMHSGQRGAHSALCCMGLQGGLGQGSCFCLPCYIPPTSVMTRQLPHLPNLTAELHSWQAEIYDLQVKNLH